MAGGKGDFAANATLNLWLGGTVPTVPATVYCALFTSAPSGAGGGTEASGGNYARVAVTNNITSWPTTSNKIKKNGVDIDFGILTAGLGMITHAALFDAATGGNILYWGPLQTPQTINAGNSFKIPVNGATFTEA